MGGCSRIVRTSVSGRTFSSQRTTSEQSKRAVESANRQESIWSVMVPDRDWGVTHPAVFGMLAAICGLHYYNGTHEPPADGKSDSVLLEEHADLEEQVKALREKTLAEAERQRQARKKGLE